MSIDTMKTEAFIIKANDVDQRDGRIIQMHETPHNTTRKDDTSWASNLKLAVGARTMFIANVDVSDGLCNEVSGIIKGIEFCNSQNMPTAVYVKFDSDRIGTKAKATEFIPPHYAGCVPIKPRKESFQLKGKTFTTTGEQIPLKLAWAVTIHKVQGQTTDQAVISLKGRKAPMAYVALSRVTHLNGIYLLDFKDSNIFFNPHIAANLALMSICKANPLIEIDHNKYFIVAHHNIQSLHRHIKDLKKKSEKPM
ncbi:ATP-dependent DNA helicase PIF1-like [Anneissia japonica]|uniref:ATP-dependent DNA helicase PIF1-like n=1 Tax=Anneissia japonica TaxID=1529436 RepID=UPI0014255987|nr:ATP-dependent DNA helicase PIF1-like [Anneissia japonica]